MAQFTTLLAIGLEFCACQQTEKKTRAPAPATTAHAFTVLQVPATAGVSARPTCPPETDDAFFFPVASLGPQDPSFDDDLLRRKAYSAQLRKMLEPSLSCGGDPEAVFRFTWLRSFHPPIAIRVSSTRSSAALAATRMSGSQGYAAAAAIDQQRRALSSDEWQSLLDALGRSDFWALPPWRDDGDPDGAQWIVEARVGSRYHVVDRWRPQSGSFRDLGLLLIKLSRLSIEEREIY